MNTEKQPTVSILAVEDDPGVADLLLHLLNDVEGWGATVAPNAAAARSTFQHVRIDVLLIDIELPGISGLELLDQLRQEAAWHDQPVIVVSALARQREVREAIKQGHIVEALTKPFDIDQLIRVVTEAIAR